MSGDPGPAPANPCLVPSSSRFRGKCRPQSRPCLKAFHPFLHAGEPQVESVLWTVLAVAPDLHESFAQDMVAESADKFHPAFLNGLRIEFASISLILRAWTFGPQPVVSGGWHHPFLRFRLSETTTYSPSEADTENLFGMAVRRARLPFASNRRNRRKALSALRTYFSFGTLA